MREFINIILEGSQQTDWDVEMKKCDEEAERLSKTRPQYPRPEDLALFDRAREAIRHLEGLGGQCHYVSEWINHHYGWDYEAGTYLAPDNHEPVCTFHFWNVLPDDTILDTTPDQHGEDERSIRIVKPNDPEFKRYTCEWYEDWHPGHDHYDATWDRERRDPSKYGGVIDVDRENDLRDQHGGDRYWYVPQDKRHYADAYLEKEKTYKKD